MKFLRFTGGSVLHEFDAIKPDEDGEEKKLTVKHIHAALGSYVSVFLMREMKVDENILDYIGENGDGEFRIAIRKSNKS